MSKNVKVYLNVPYAEKDEAKQLGSWFDGDKKKWYIPSKVSDENRKKLIDRWGIK